jgi:hypothetical protein
MYPYLTERMLHQSTALALLGEIVVQHRERWTAAGIRGGRPAARSPGCPGIGGR